MKRDIVVAGYADVDIIKTIERFPMRQGLVGITNITRSLGGAVCNCGLDLAMLDPALTVKPLAVIGDDANGAYMRTRFAALPNIDPSLLVTAGETAFTDVLDEADTRLRTFLVFKGANRLFDEATADPESLDCSVFHFGYICLMDALDVPDERYGSKLGRLLSGIQRKGILTSVDAVTDDTGRHRELMPAAFRYADLACVNELEAEAGTGIALRHDGQIDPEAMERAARRFLEWGVSRWAVIHAPECAVGVGTDGSTVYLPSPKLPEGWIRGTVGAGDAFVSGVLLGLRDLSSLRTAMEQGTAAAIMSLTAPGASEGILPMEQAMERYRAVAG